MFFIFPRNIIVYLLYTVAKSLKFKVQGGIGQEILNNLLLTITLFVNHIIFELIKNVVYSSWIL